MPRFWIERYAGLRYLHRKPIARAMQNRVQLQFRIDAFTPATLPMKRLAEYMLELAQLLGEPEHVHFVGVSPDPAKLVHEVDWTSMPKVRERIRQSQGGDGASSEPSKRRDKIDRMLADDNATASLTEQTVGGVALEFPGRELAELEARAVTEHGEIQGQLIRIGGADETAHATLRDGDESVSCEITKGQARVLAPYLYGPWIKIEGQGRWHRSREGRWIMASFRMDRLVPLTDETLSQAFARVRLGNEDSVESEPLPTAEEFLELRRDW